VGTFALLWLAGAWWANRSQDGWPSRLVRTTSDNSYGVYLSHIMFLDLLATLGLGRLDAHVPWIVTVAIAVPVAWAGASLLTVVLARTPLSRWLTGRPRPSSAFPEQSQNQPEGSQPTSSSEPQAGSARAGRLTR
jgi:peptidoglycan/LPS O-acetylase OafA/YrhL